MEGELARVDRRGTLEAGRIFGLDDCMGPAGQLSRDSQIGSIGGGNHFVEIQRVEKILDGTTAHAWGFRPGMVTVMVHTGSVSIGHLSGGYFRDVVRRIYPRTLRHPENGIFVLPQGERYAEEAGLFWDALHNAGNFAFANRLFLALTALAGLRRVCGDDVDFRLLYDAPHNFIWREERDGEEWAVHRKGACPARGYRRRWRGRRSSTTASRCWCRGPWGPAASSWRGRGTRRRSPAPATAPAAPSRAATRCGGTRTSSSASWSASAW